MDTKGIFATAARIANEASLGEALRRSAFLKAARDARTDPVRRKQTTRPDPSETDPRTERA